STVRAIQNTTSKAKDGSHALMISFNSDNDQMYPTIGSNNVPRTLNGGETLTGYILKTQGSSVEVIFYVADQSGTWFKDDNSTTYVNSVQTWYPITFKVPANFQGPATHVGVVLFGYDAVVYIDAISWR
ncbi:MAG: hypothetical protein J2P37_32240, partial [Ktedonobacteraceae bacterium]|nr:hypothetical protein [Ktedonobacteraceae bacterium]